MKTIFKKGDRVFDIQYGWGTVIDIEAYNRYSVVVEFDDKAIHSYLYDASYPSEGGYPRKVLSFTEYTLEGFTQERPEELPKRGQVVWVRNELPSEWMVGHFFKKDNGKYHIFYSPSLKGWNISGTEIKTINPYENEQ